MGVEIDHVASCPEDDPLTCATDPYPPYEHHQQITWARLDPTVSVGLGRGLQASFSAPVDLRVLRVGYTTLDGDSLLEPPSDIHHRDETLAGLVDGRLLVRAFTTSGAWTLGAGAGSTLPFGGTVEDPFVLTEGGQPHQHMQFGTGTFDPLTSLSAIRVGERWGAMFGAGARAPLYANREGYRGVRSVDLSGGPTFRAHPKVTVYAMAEPTFETPERWHGVAHGGRLSLVSAAGASWAVERVVLQAELRTTALQYSFEGADDALVQRWVATIGASFKP